jgi:hypothetical protein
MPAMPTMQDDDDKFQFWNTAPVDPIAKAQAERIPHHSRATHGVLFHQSACPIGPHTGKIMERVPASWLMQIRTQQWAKTAAGYNRILDYIERHIHQIEPRAVKENQ